jgi:hypothetical protein
VPEDELCARNRTPLPCFHLATTPVLLDQLDTRRRFEPDLLHIAKDVDFDGL